MPRDDEPTAEKDKLTPITEGSQDDGDGDGKLEPLAKPEKTDEAEAAAAALPAETPETSADRERLLLAASGALAHLTTRVQIVGRMLSYPVVALCPEGTYYSFV
ncbi:hypothetical protein BOX15_Mlig022814g1 [Macrostomum lignano]|uniref:Uncharacterized protein n=1 Tax=Macrostomum lignano TaxID=282301 RepID=A0A267DK12_9PLAT|nr:hypothetical protein BOX15_Mlig022814g1 [Macrostomum lignano]